MNYKKSKKNRIIYFSIILIAVLICIYIVVSIVALMPYLILFIKGEYIINGNDLPTYKEIFSNIFVGLGIMTSGLFSYLLYKNSEQVRIKSSKSEANKIFFQYKFCILKMTLDYLEANIECICFDTEDGEQLKKQIKNKFDLPQYDNQTYYDFQSSIGEIAAYIKEVDSRTQELDITKMFSMNLDFYKYLNSDYTNSECPVYLNKELNSLNINNKLSANKIFAWLWGFLIKNDMRLLNDTYSRILSAILKTSK